MKKTNNTIIDGMEFEKITLNEFMFIMFGTTIDDDYNGIEKISHNIVKSIYKLMEFNNKYPLTIISNLECGYLFIWKNENKYYYYSLDMEWCDYHYDCDFTNDIMEFNNSIGFDSIMQLYDDIINNTMLFNDINIFLFFNMMG